MQRPIANYLDVSATAIDRTNVGDVLKDAWRGVKPVTEKTAPKPLPAPTQFLRCTKTGFQVEFGHAPWNTDFHQRTLIGSDKRCNFIPLDNMEGTDKLIFTLPGNMLVGCDQDSDKEDVKIRECE